MFQSGVERIWLSIDQKTQCFLAFNWLLLWSNSGIPEIGIYQQIENTPLQLDSCVGTFRSILYKSQCSLCYPANECLSLTTTIHVLLVLCSYLILLPVSNICCTVIFFIALFLILCGLLKLSQWCTLCFSSIKPLVNYLLLLPSSLPPSSRSSSSSSSLYSHLNDHLGLMYLIFFNLLSWFWKFHTSGLTDVLYNCYLGRSGTELVNVFWFVLLKWPLQWN